MEETEILIKKAKFNKILIIILTLSLFSSLVYITYDKLKPKAKVEKEINEKKEEETEDLTEVEDHMDIIEDLDTPTSADTVNFWKHERNRIITYSGLLFGNFKLEGNDLSISLDQRQAADFVSYLKDYQRINANIAAGTYKVPGSYVDFAEYTTGHDATGLKGVLAVKNDGTVSFISYTNFLQNGTVKVSDNYKDFKDIVSIKPGMYTGTGGFGGGVSTILTDINGQQFEIIE